MDQFEDTTCWDIAWLRSVGFQAEGDSEVFIFDQEKDLRLYIESDGSAGICDGPYESPKSSYISIPGTYNTRMSIIHLLSGLQIPVDAARVKNGWERN